MRFIFNAVLALALSFCASAAVAQSITTHASVPYADEDEIDSRVLRECDKLQSQLAEFTQEYASNHNIDVVLATSVNADSEGRVLLMQIDDAVSGGNAFTGHRKFSRIRGTLYEDGETVASFRARRNSGGGAFGGYKGSCSVLGRTMRALGRDVAGWLQNPVDGARLGDM